MDFGLSDDQGDILRTARELLAERAKPERVRRHAEARRTDDELWKELCELGWPGIAIAEEHGGQGFGAIELGLLAEELGRTIAPVPFLPTVLAATLIGHAGSEEQQQRWLPGLAGGTLTGALGARDLLPGGAGADVIVIVESGSAWVADVADVTLEDVPLIDPTRPAARVAGGEGEALAGDVAGAVDRALVAISAELVGVCQRALDDTVAYVKERRQFGTPIGAYQAVSHRCAQMLLDTEKARSTTSFAAWTADADRERLAEGAAMAKASASEAGREVTAAAIQMHGGIGFTWEADVHWLFKRAQVDAALLGGAKEHRAHLAAILAQRARGLAAA